MKETIMNQTENTAFLKTEIHQQKKNLKEKIIKIKASTN
jgi:hypothetical protein